jgi:hypothetical protein
MAFISFVASFYPISRYAVVETSLVSALTPLHAPRSLNSRPCFLTSSFMMPSAVSTVPKALWADGPIELITTPQYQTKKVCL